MSHCIQAIIAKKDVAQKIANDWVCADLVELPQEFSLIPITEPLHDDIVELVNDTGGTPHMEFDYLSSALVAMIEQSSFYGKVAYVETEYFGGVGGQSAAAWEGGKLIVPPLKTRIEWKDGDYVQVPPGSCAINMVLARLGVYTRTEKDEFEMLGLGNHRSTEGWANA